MHPAFGVILAPPKQLKELLPQKVQSVEYRFISLWNEKKYLGHSTQVLLSTNLSPNWQLLKFNTNYNVFW